jgi:hypothetical protein
MKSMSIAVLMLALGSVPAWAALGQYEGSVGLDQQYMKSEDHVQDFQTYKVHQLTTTNGFTVREYVSPKGLVFGIGWGGRSVPDLHQLLGNYVTNLQTATAAQTQIRHLRGITVKTDDFVFTNSAHMRFSAGKAYVPSLVPANVSVEVVR